MGKNSLDRKVIRNELLNNVRFTVYNTGLLEIQDYRDSDVVKMTNVTSLNDSGYLDKFMELCSETLQSAGHRIRFSAQNSRTIVYEFNEIANGDTVRSIIDEPSFNNTTKLMSIISYLSVCPTLNFQTIKSFAEKQINLENIESSVNLNFESFLLPDFALPKDKSQYGWYYARMKQSFYENFLTLMGAFIEGDPEETLESYIERTPELPFVPIAKGGLIIGSARFGAQILEYKPKKFQRAIAGLTIRETIRFINMYKDHLDYPAFTDFLVERAKSDTVTFYEEVDGDNERLNKYVDFEGLCRFLTRRETHKLVKFLKTNHPDTIKYTSLSFYKFSSFCIAYTFLQRGCEGVTELIHHLKTPLDDSEPMNNFNLNYQLSPETFLKSGFMEAMDDKYLDMPIAWALNFANAEKNKRPAAALAAL